MVLGIQSYLIHGATDRNVYRSIECIKTVDNAPNFSGILMVSLTKCIRHQFWLVNPIWLHIIEFFPLYWLNFGYEIIKMSFPIVPKWPIWPTKCSLPNFEELRILLPPHCNKSECINCVCLCDRAISFG